MEYLRTIAHLRPRTNMFSAAFRVRSVAAYAIHKFFNENGFVYAHTPLITGSDCEGAGEMFTVTTLDPENPPRTGGGHSGLYPGLLPEAYVPDCFWAVGSGVHGDGLWKSLYIWADLPCRKVLHNAMRQSFG